MRSPITCWQHTGCEADPRDQSSTERASEVTASTDRPTKRRPDSASGNHPLISSIPSQARKAGTHNHRTLLLSTLWLQLLSVTKSCGYGSRIALAEPVIGRAFARPVGSLV